MRDRRNNPRIARGSNFVCPATPNPLGVISSVTHLPVSYTLGNGLNVYRSYDTLGRLYGQWVCNGPANATCSGGTQIYGTLGQWKGSQLQYLSDTVLAQQVTNGYDSFNRLTARTVTSGTVQNYTYSYDRYGNRLTQTPLQRGYSFNPTINPANNHITTSGFTYDAAGNMTNDTVPQLHLRCGGQRHPGGWRQHRAIRLRRVQPADPCADPQRDDGIHL